MKRKLKISIATLLSLTLFAVTLSGCDKKESNETTENKVETTAGDLSESETETEEVVGKVAHPQIEYSYATKEEGIEYLISNDGYYDRFTQNDLDYKAQKIGANMEEYTEFAKEQVLDFTEEQKQAIDEIMNYIEVRLEEEGLTLPEIEPIVLISTTQKEECEPAAYTHGTHIFFNAEYMANPGTGIYAKLLMTHEIFHCITRSNPEFRKEMYKLIHFTVQDEEFEIPPSVLEYYITNPDVEHHNSYATFTINGEKIDCFTAMITTKHFENEGESFLDYMTTALVPIDGSDVYYLPEDASDFYDVFGNNTGYVIDPEECMADNFSYAVIYGIDGPQGQGYESPEIIKGIIYYLK